MKKKTEKSNFLKFTRLNGDPIWINAAFVVTVEPRIDGGSIVVPIGDGLDYDVRESPEVVLALLGGADPADIVPVVTKDAIVKKTKKTAAKKTETVKTDAVAKKSGTARASAQADKAENTTDAPADENAPGDSAATAAADNPVVPIIPHDDLERLRKMAPRTLKKLENTLIKQFKIMDSYTVIDSLVKSGAISHDGTHIIWNKPKEETVFEVK